MAASVLDGCGYLFQLRKGAQNDSHCAIVSNLLKQYYLNGSSLTYNTSARHKRHERYECDTSATRVLQEQHKCDTSTTQTTRVRHEWKILILIAARLKTHFSTLIFAIWQVKDYKERNSYYDLPFWNASFPCQNAFKKFTPKTSATSQYNCFSKILQNLKHFHNSRVIV